MEYEFTDDTAQKLNKALRNLPDIIQKEDRMYIKIGKSYDNVCEHMLIDLLKETNNRVKLDITGVDTVSIFFRKYITS